MTTALSFGGGVQTTAILVLIAQGESPSVDVVVFADTGCEWPETYDYIARYIKPLCERLAIPFVEVKHPRYTLYEYYWKYRAIPLPMINRSCTHNFKINPIGKFYLAQGVEHQLIGFSLDEVGRSLRYKPIRKGITTSFPLITEYLTRADCVFEIQRFGWPSPLKSSCICCSFTHPNRIVRLARLHPDLFEQVALLEDRALNRMRKPFYISGRPWRELAVPQADMFADWDYGCGEGYCMR